MTTTWLSYLKLYACTLPARVILCIVLRFSLKTHSNRYFCFSLSLSVSTKLWICVWCVYIIHNLYRNIFTLESRFQMTVSLLMSMLDMHWVSILSMIVNVVNLPYQLFVNDAAILYFVSIDIVVVCDNISWKSFDGNSLLYTK